jgi:8-oxo-dGTP pyrophosphatase MutT (NUDIX family)
LLILFTAVFFESGLKKTGGLNESIDWSKVSPKLGITVELCAGIVDDPKLSLMEIMQKEVLEECGYAVPLSNFEQVISYR